MEPFEDEDSLRLGDGESDGDGEGHAALEHALEMGVPHLGGAAGGALGARRAETPSEEANRKSVELLCSMLSAQGGSGKISKLVQVAPPTAWSHRRFW